MIKTSRKAWVQSATLGTAHPNYAHTGGDDGRRERDILQQAASTHWRKIGGYIPFITETPREAPPPRDPRAYISERSQQHFLMMMNGLHADVLPEFLQLVTQHEKHIPQELMQYLWHHTVDKDGHPFFFNNRFTDDPFIVTRLIDDWLLNRLARYRCRNWRWYDVQNAAYIWQHGTHDDRIALFYYLRWNDADLARELVRTTWQQEGEMRRYLLDWYDNVGTADEPFLECVLDEQDAKERQQAARLLSQLKTSQFVERMIARLEAAVTLVPGKQLNVQPTRVYTEDMLRDGLSRHRPHEDKRLTDERWWLLQILEHIAPSLLCERWQIDHKTLLHAARNSGHWQLFIRAWRTATIRTSDRPMARAMLNIVDDIPNDDIKRMAALLPNTEREAYLLHTFTNHPRNFDYLHPAYPVLETYRQPWSVDFTLKFLQYFQKHARFSQSKPALRRKFARGVGRFSLYMPLTMHRPVVKSLRKRANIPEWTATIDEIDATFAFRQAIVEALKSDSAYTSE